LGFLIGNGLAKEIIFFLHRFKDKKMKKTQKLIGLLFIIISILLIIDFHLSHNFFISENFQSLHHINGDFIMNLVALSIIALLLIASISLLFNYQKTNFLLALFGFTALEEFIFSVLDLKITQFTTVSIVILVICSIMFLYASFFNVFKLKKLTFGRIILEAVFGAFITLIPLL
jgi:hypothetical protein